MSQLESRRILLAVTGASGTVYAERLAEVLLPIVPRIYLLMSAAGEKVAYHELNKKASGFSLIRVLKGELTEQEKSVVRVLKNEDLFSPVASGSSVPTDMVIVPCSMGTLARISQGQSSCLIERAADVVLKQNKNLVVCPRETPLNLIHLRNMTSLVEAGARMVPPMPAFYQRPKTVDEMVDFVVGRIMEILNISHSLYPAWNSRMI